MKFFKATLTELVFVEHQGPLSRLLGPLAPLRHTLPLLAIRGQILGLEVEQELLAELQRLVEVVQLIKDGRVFKNKLKYLMLDET